MRPALGGKRAGGGASLGPGWAMAACGYLLLLGCIVANLPLALVHLNEWRATPEEDNQRYSAPISMLEHRNEHSSRLHGDHSKKVLPFPKAKQQENSQSLIRGRRYYTVFRNQEGILDEEQNKKRKEYYIPVPPSRLSPHVYQEAVYPSEQQTIRYGVKDILVPQPDIGVPSQIYQDLEDEKARQANKHHDTGQEHEQNHVKEQKSTDDHDDYWVVGQRRFRIIVLIILGVLIGFSILLILAWFFVPRRVINKIRTRK
ncbi:uncharacterized protein LOC129714397 isoform X2 [Leucoraja erinacea]|uniref:uncharacterized protein LOC129714397 isoform X2 n=1 Tax=Leucoraja erinaceus TaxID=7782 RepID=UPI0024574C3E|nr:uncharacterized protein LOC129714397 isoform X2 [Leucoraja erinacea]